MAGFHTEFKEDSVMFGGGGGGLVACPVKIMILEAADKFWFNKCYL